MTEYKCFGKTDIGLLRKNNEDTFIADSDSGIYLVADGMGGAAAGELASQIFSDIAVAEFSNKYDKAEGKWVDFVQTIFQKANNEILKHVESHPEHKGMGCTAELLFFTKDSFVVGHMGDSRTYRFRKNQLIQLTKDHSLVQQQVEQGLISAEEARTHTLRNVILRAVGVNENPLVDVFRGRAIPMDIYMLCSDGLTDLVDDKEIADILSEKNGLEKKVENLIRCAMRAGGKDNITVVLVMVQ